MEGKAVEKIKKLGFQWETQDPFLFCAYHKDQYPPGNGHMGPNASLEGRNIGHDFTLKNGWRMYHGSRVPGFPAHPHKGFETVTLVDQGFADHSDSLGAAGRFGNGDVQWMTAGKGVMHCEMFPLLDPHHENPLLLFQIWLNLPSSKKNVNPHFKMLWSESIPLQVLQDENGNKTSIKIITGKSNGMEGPAPAPDSWAADPNNEVAIWKIHMEPNAKWVIPSIQKGINRTLFFYEGRKIEAEGFKVSEGHSLDLVSDKEVIIQNGNQAAEILFLQGRPINEPVVKHGPFVMNSQQEISQALKEYQLTQFGGWPWSSYEHTHPKERPRFALHADGREEIKNI